MSDSNEHLMVRVRLDAKAELDRVGKLLGQTQKELLSRLIEHFASLTYDEQRRWLRVIETNETITKRSR